MTSPREQSGLAIRYREQTWIVGDKPALVIGRAYECDVVIRSSAVSRRHACLRTEDGRTMIEDLSSGAGVYVNAELIDGLTTLHLGDRIVLADAVILVVRASQPRTSGETKVPRAAIGSDNTQPLPATGAGVDVVAVFGTVAQDALEEGSAWHAEAAAEHLFQSVMARPALCPAERVDDVAELFARLAVATEDGLWLDRILELRLALSSRMSLVAIRTVARIARALPVLPNELRFRYIAWARFHDLSDAELSALDDLAVAGSR